MVTSSMLDIEIFRHQVKIIDFIGSDLSVITSYIEQLSNSYK
jgi:hypothetical protein